MFRKVVHCVLVSLFCCVPIVGLLGCSTQDSTTPVQTSGNDIEQFLANNPDENYSSDGQAEAETEEMEQDNNQDDAPPEAPPETPPETQPE